MPRNTDNPPEADTTGTYWVFVDVIDVRQKIFTVAHAAVGKAALPDWSLRSDAVRKSTFDKLDRSL